MKKIIVIFKTHLDLGFTDFAKNVGDQYIKEYIPNALRVAKEMRGEKERFIWSTGSWLIEKFLEESSEKELLEDAVSHGEIRWHGLPFTTHTELMDRELFLYGLGISKKLDQKFGMKTIAAKMTDVPGHTKAIIPLLSQMGIRFLHIGVNPASTRPDVPNLFRWRADSGEEVVVMYNGDYGELTEIGNSGTAVYFAHTGDNGGPQSAEAIRKIYEELHEKYPNTEITAGTLEDVARIAVEEELEVITEEIGDTWIHGTGTDPKKVCQYRALLRLKDEFPKEEMDKLYRKLLLIPEHTWGLDEKRWLGLIEETEDSIKIEGEHRYFKKEEFLKAKETEKFRKMEQSWQEQRDYISDAVDNLSQQTKERAEKVLQEARRDLTDISGYEQKKPGEIFTIGEYKVQVNKKGEITFLAKGSETIADQNHRIGSFLYEVFSKNEYERFREQYLIIDEVWALEDFGKYGVEQAVPCYQKYVPEQVRIWVHGNELIIKMKLPREAAELYGGMEETELKVKFARDAIYFDLAWTGKQESRVPEAFWLGFCPKDTIKWIEKMGAKIEPDKVVSNGNRRMHALDKKVALEKMMFETIDAPLISIEEPGLLNFTNELPRLDKGFYVNLFNNVWGTNFVMWYGEDARFRFCLHV